MLDDGFYPKPELSCGLGLLKGCLSEAAVAAVYFNAGLGPLPSYFLLLAQKKVTKEKGTRMSPLFRKLAA
jgi:hypothetical protein